MAPARRESLIGRAALSLALFCGFWALGAALVVALSSIPVAQARYGDGPGPGGLLAGGLALWVAWGLRPRGFRSRDGGPDPLGRDAFPALHAFIDDVARRCGVPVPDAVHVSARANASIGARRRLLGLRRTRALELGLPLFAFLDRDELASVVAHELGHARGGDVALGAWVYRTRSAVMGAIEALDESAFLLDAPFRLYARLFLRVSGAVSRGQELAADACAVDAAGARATFDALRRIEHFGPLWEVYFAHDAVPLLEHGVHVPLVDGFRRFLAEPELRADVVTAIAAARASPPDPTDTHPPTAERLRAVDPARAVELAGGVPGPGCLELLGGAETAEAAWAARAFSVPPQVVGWDEVGAHTLLPALAAELAGSPLDPDLTPPDALPRLVREADALWSALGRGVNLLSPAARRAAGLRALRGFLALSLARRGFAPEVRPGAELVLCRGRDVVAPGRVVAALAEGTLRGDAYLAACAGWERPAA